MSNYPDFTYYTFKILSCMGAKQSLDYVKAIPKSTSLFNFYSIPKYILTVFTIPIYFIQPKILNT